MSVVSQLIRICSLPTERRCPTSPTLRVALAADNTGLRLCKGWTAATQTCTSIWRCISVSSRYLQMVQNRKSYIQCMRKSDIEYIQISLSIPMISPLDLPYAATITNLPISARDAVTESLKQGWGCWLNLIQTARGNHENRVQDQELLFQELFFFYLW